jgi:hypothetical protein
MVFAVCLNTAKWAGGKVLCSLGTQTGFAVFRTEEHTADNWGFAVLQTAEHTANPLRFAVLQTEEHTANHLSLAVLQP